LPAPLHGQVAADDIRPPAEPRHDQGAEEARTGDRQSEVAQGDLGGRDLAVALDVDTEEQAGAPQDGQVGDEQREKARPREGSALSDLCGS
jgi:hypothetical protein